ncbi:MAG: ABC transporter ATP-binding protein [Chitinophagia bacterium]|nr:ABC transporter ATP-binding protein [Chitinophagia bacterium]
MQWLSVNQVVKQLNTELVVGGVSFSLQAGARLGIAGETGAGKSSLLKIIAGLLQPDQGSVYFEEERVPGPDEKLLPGHPRIAYLSQHFELINHYRVNEYLALTNQLEIEQANRLYVLCGIDHLLNRKTSQLSGGERQRVALANAIAKRPRILLLDEPFSNLDLAHKEKIKEMLSDLEKAFSITALIVSHDASDLLSWADTILLMQQGRVVQQGTPASLYLHPINAYCAGLLGPFTEVSGEWLAELAGMERSPQVAPTYFARPEHFAISPLPGPAPAQQVVIESVFYMGSHTLIIVQSKGGRVKVSTSHCPYEKGQLVYLSVKDWVW